MVEVNENDKYDPYRALPNPVREDALVQGLPRRWMDADSVHELRFVSADVDHEMVTVKSSIDAASKVEAEAHRVAEDAAAIATLRIRRLLGRTACSKRSRSS